MPPNHKKPPKDFSDGGLFRQRQTELGVDTLDLGDQSISGGLQAIEISRRDTSATVNGGLQGGDLVR